MKPTYPAHAAAFASALLLLAPTTYALDWDDGGDPDQDWSTLANWVGDVLPTATDFVRIGSFDAEITTPGITFTDLYLGDPLDGFGGVATLTMTGGDITGENMRFGTDNTTTGTGGNGTFTFTDGTITLAEISNDAQCVEIGRAPSAVGLMVMGDGTTNPVLNYGNGRFEVGQHATSTSTFTFQSGTVNGTDNLIIGQGNGTGVATMTIGGFANPAAFTTSADLNMNNQNASLTINGNGTVSHRDLNFSNQNGKTTTINVNTGGTLNSGGFWNDRAGNSVLNVSGGTVNFLVAAPTVREVEQLTITDGSTLSLTLGNLVTLPLPLSVAGDDSKSASLSGTITFTTDPGTTNNSATVDTWTAGTGTWDTITPLQSQWDLAASPDRLAAGIVATVIDSPSVAIAGSPTIVAPGWTPTVNANDVTLTSLAGGVAISPRSAVFNDGAADVLAGASAGDDLLVGLGVANASVLTLTDVNAFDVTDDLVIGGAGLGTVNIGTIGGGATGNMDVTIGDDIVFGDGGPEGGTLNLYEGNLVVNGTIIEGTDDPDVQDAAVNNAQLHIDGGTLTVTGNAIAVQRFAIAQATGTTGSYSQTGGTISHSGTASLGVSGSGDLTVDGVTLDGGNLILAETATGGSTLTMTNSSWTVGGVLENANLGNSDIILNGTSSITQTSGDFRVADAGTGTLTLIDDSSITHSGGNFETAELGTSNGTLTMNTTGGITCESDNFILGQSDGSVMALNLIAGTIDLLPSGAASTIGHMNCNGGVATITMTGGSILIGEDLLGASTPTGVLRWNQSAGSVLINDTLDCRANGDDQIDLSGTAVMKLGQEPGRDGNLDMTSASTVGLGIGGNWLTLRGSNVTFELIDGAVSDLLADTDASLNWEFDDTGLSTIKVGGTVNLNFAYANFTHSGTTPPTAGTFTLIDNQGAGAVVGEFTGLGEGAVVDVSGQLYQLSYLGGDGNDVTLTPLNDPAVSIAKNGDVSEGNNAVWTLTASPAPSGGNIDVDVTYAGTAIDGSDFTGVASVSILDGQTTATLTVPTTLDSDFEGCETIIAGIAISGTSPAAATVGAPSASTISLFDGNVAPTGTNLAQSIIDGGATVPFADIEVFDPDADYDSKVSTTGEAFYYYSGASDVSSFTDGRPNDDFAFDIDDGFPELSEPAGFSVDIEFIPQAADLVGTVMFWEIGGTSNGASVHLVDGIPHLLVKCGGGGGDAPTDDDSNPANGIRDLDWAGDDTISVPLAAAGAVVAGLPSRFAIVFDIVGDTVKFSVNGAAEQTETLLNNDSNNWRGDHSVANAQISGGIGATNTVSGSPFESAVVQNFSGGTGAVPCVRFWNESTGSIAATTGGPDIVTATLTIQGWSAGAGDLSAISGFGETYGSGVWSVSGNLATVNAALAAVLFVQDTGTTYPIIIDVSLDDVGPGGPTTGSIVIYDAALSVVYVDDDFSGAAGSAIADADGGPPVSPATFLADAFPTLAQALAVVDPTGTIIVNDGDYSTESAALADTIVLKLTDTIGGVAIGGLDATETNSVDLQGNALTVGATNTANTIDCPISGTGGLTKVGTSRLLLRALNTFTGLTTVSEGQLRVGSRELPLLLGGLDSEVLVEAGALLEFNPVVDLVMTQSKLISGDGAVQTLQDGTVVFDGPANTFSGGFLLGDAATSNFDGASGNKNGFVVVNNNGHLGTGLVTSKGSQLQAGTTGIVIPNDIEIDGGGFRVGGTNDFEFAGSVSPIGVTDRGYGNYGLEGLDLTISGPIDLDGGNLIVEGSEGKDNGTWTFTGDISGAGNVEVRTSFDDGVATFTGTNTYAGTTRFRTGTTFYDGSLDTFGAITAENGGIFAGAGSIINNITVNGGGTLAPGSSAGSTLLIDFGVTFDNNSTFRVDIDSSLATANLLDSNGDVTIGTGVTLDVNDVAAVPQVLTIGTKLTIINYSDFGSTLSGEFAGLPNGSTFTAGANQFTIDYDDGGSATVTLTAAGSANAFNSWVLANYPGLTGGFSGDPDLDGVLSGLEWYFYNSDPTAGGAFGPALSNPVQTGPGTYTFTHLRPVDRTGLTETYQWSTDLQTFHNSGDTDGSTTVTLTPGDTVPAMTGYETVTVTVTVTAGPIPAKLFSNLTLSN